MLTDIGLITLILVFSLFYVAEVSSAGTAGGAAGDDDLIADIASLDQADEAGSLTEAEHLELRAPLLTRAKELLTAQAEGAMEGGLE